MFEIRNSDPLKMSTEGTKVWSQDLRLAAVLTKSLEFFQALRDIKQVNLFNASLIIDEVVEPKILQQIYQKGDEVGFSQAQTNQFIRQKLTGGYFILERYLAFTAYLENISSSRHQAIDIAIANLDLDEKNFIEKVSLLNPVIAATAALYVGQLKDEPSFATPMGNFAARLVYHDGIVKKSVHASIEYFDAAHQAYLEIEQAALFLRRSFRDDDHIGRAFIEAWKNDLVRPIIESIAHITADGLAVLESFHPSTTIWYGANYPMPQGQNERYKIANDWKEYAQFPHIPSPLFKFLGFENAADMAIQNLKSRDSLPVFGFIGKNDCGLFVKWMRDTFREINRAFSSGRPQITSNSHGAVIAKLNHSTTVVFRGEETKTAQARFGILLGREPNQLSIRVDRERNGLALDFGSSSVVEMLSHMGEICARNKRELEKEQELMRKIGEEYGKMEVDWRMQRYFWEEQAQVADRISFFGSGCTNFATEMPLFATMLVSVGKLFGTRSLHTISHHWRDSTRDLSQRNDWQERDFQVIVAKLKRGLAYRNFAS